MELQMLYDAILHLQAELEENHDDAALGCPDYKAIKALAATYELQDYLASRIAAECPNEEYEDMEDAIAIPFNELSGYSDAALEFLLEEDARKDCYTTNTVVMAMQLLSERAGNTGPSEAAKASWAKFVANHPEFFGEEA